MEEIYEPELLEPPDDTAVSSTDDGDELIAIDDEIEIEPAELLCVTLEAI